MDQGASAVDKLFSWAPFTCSFPVCCDSNVLYEVSTSNSGSTNGVAGLDTTILNNLNINPTWNKGIGPADTSIIGTYQFYIYAYNPYGTSVFSNQVTINVNCILSSTSLSISTYPNSLTAD